MEAKEEKRNEEQMAEIEKKMAGQQI